MEQSDCVCVCVCVAGITTALATAAYITLPQEIYSLNLIDSTIKAWTHSKHSEKNLKKYYSSILDDHNVLIQSAKWLFVKPVPN